MQESLIGLGILTGTLQEDKLVACGVQGNFARQMLTAVTASTAKERANSMPLGTVSMTDLRRLAVRHVQIVCAF